MPGMRAVVFIAKMLEPGRSGRSGRSRFVAGSRAFSARGPRPMSDTLRPDPRPAPLRLSLPRLRGNARLLRRRARPAAGPRDPRRHRAEHRRALPVRAHLLPHGRRLAPRLLRPRRRRRRRAVAEHAGVGQPHRAARRFDRRAARGEGAPRGGRRRGARHHRPPHHRVDLLLRPERHPPRADRADGERRDDGAPRARSARRGRGVDAREAGAPGRRALPRPRRGARARGAPRAGATEVSDWGAMDA